MSFQRISTMPIMGQCLCRLVKSRVAEKLQELRPYLKSTDTLLDVGSGNGVLCDSLRKSGYRVTALDVAQLTFTNSVKPIIYDGVSMPFRDSSFDVILLVTVLHHARNPEQVLTEAKRVARRIIVIEETYSNIFDKYLTYFIDSVFNLEFFGHPHTNKTDAGWKEVFGRLGLKIAHAKYSRSILVLNRVTYVLESP